MQDDVVALFAYDSWANLKVLDACRRLTAEQYVAEPVPGWSSVRSTIYHIAMATAWNLLTLAGDSDESIATEVLRHIVNHSTYHRGQVASKLKQFGIEQPITDFFWWMIEQFPQEA
jgi:uncharacterized damage-inducible protein DinB